MQNSINVTFYWKNLSWVDVNIGAPLIEMSFGLVCHYHTTWYRFCRRSRDKRLNRLNNFRLNFFMVSVEDFAVCCCGEYRGGQGEWTYSAGSSIPLGLCSGREWGALWLCASSRNAPSCQYGGSSWTDPYSSLWDISKASAHGNGLQGWRENLPSGEMSFLSALNLCQILKTEFSSGRNRLWKNVRAYFSLWNISL